MRQSLHDLNEQIHDYSVNRDVARAMKADRAELIDDVQKLLDKANAEYQHAAAMHFTSKCSYYGGQVDVLKKVIDLI
jgi:hypothetical protein